MPAMTRRLAATLLVLPLLAGCQKAGHALLELDYTFDQSMVSLGNYLQDTFDQGYHEQEISTEVSLATPRYCYRTLGEVECYREPLGGSRQRLLGVDTDTLDYAEKTPYVEYAPEANAKTPYSAPGKSAAPAESSSVKTPPTAKTDVKVSQNSNLPLPLQTGR